jgi:hypothetical protein
MPGGMPLAPQLIKLNKPDLKSSIKIKPFGWKRVNLDPLGEVATSDMKKLDPLWKGKYVIWREIDESKLIDLKIVEELYSDKTKAVVAKVE